MFSSLLPSSLLASELRLFLCFAVTFRLSKKP
nr:MAG TPA: hypothetical protein [Caudoviricetes sp.]